MGKAKLRPIAAIMKIIEGVPGDAREELEADLRDLLRPAPKPRSKPKPERKPSQKRKVEKDATTGEEVLPHTRCKLLTCGKPFDNNVHHIKSAPGYHEFVEPAGEAKGVSV